MQQISPAPPRRTYIYGTLAAIGLAYLFFFAGYPSLIYDSWGYYILAGLLRTKGFFGWPREAAALRTYGYPLFTALATGWRPISPEAYRLIVFHVQVLLFLAACGAISRSLARICRCRSAGPAAYLVSALNPYLLSHATEALTDLLSAVLVGLAVALSWPGPVTDRHKRTSAYAFSSFFCASYAAAVRPANIIVVGALLLVWLFRYIRFRDFPKPVITAVVIGIGLPLVPQAALNYAKFGKPSPLAVESLYRWKADAGMSGLKYATDVRPGKEAGFKYINPLYHGEPTPAAFAVHRPLAYLETLGLHAFAMMDHDFAFTYLTETRPWYRWPLSVINYLLLYSAALGAWFVLQKWRADRRVNETTLVFLSTAVVAVAYVALYLFTEVEDRYALPMDLLATPFIVFGLMSAKRVLGGSGGRRWLTVISLSATLFVGMCVYVSAWLTQQAPHLR